MSQRRESPSIVVTIHEEAVRAGKRAPMSDSERRRLEAVALECQRRLGRQLVEAIAREAA